ncbi:hypothetical protein GCM10027093_22990 [Paraburkholderia jirisanensis]
MAQNDAQRDSGCLARAGGLQFRSGESRELFVDVHIESSEAWSQKLDSDMSRWRAISHNVRFNHHIGLCELRSLPDRARLLYSAPCNAVRQAARAAQVLSA